MQTPLLVTGMSATKRSRPDEAENAALPPPNRQQTGSQRACIIQKVPAIDGKGCTGMEVQLWSLQCVLETSIGNFTGTYCVRLNKVSDKSRLSRQILSLLVSSHSPSYSSTDVHPLIADPYAAWLRLKE